MLDNQPLKRADVTRVFVPNHKRKRDKNERVADAFTEKRLDPFKLTDIPEVAHLEVDFTQSDPGLSKGEYETAIPQPPSSSVI